MSAFGIYTIILAIIYVVYYMMAILWESKYHPHKSGHEYDPGFTFGFKQVFVFENFDGTYSLSEDNRRPSVDYHFNDEDDDLFESPEDNLDFTPEDETPEEVESPIEGFDDDPEVRAIYERIKREQEKIDWDLFLAEHPEPEERPTLFERLLESREEMISAVEGMEVYYSKEFLYVMNLPVDINTRVKRQIIPYDTPVQNGLGQENSCTAVDDEADPYDVIPGHNHHSYDPNMEPESHIVEERWFGCGNEEVIAENTTEELRLLPDRSVPDLPFDVDKVRVCHLHHGGKYVIEIYYDYNDWFYSVLKADDLLMYLERDSKGNFTRRITPAMLASVYFKSIMKYWEIQCDEVLEEVGKCLSWKEGVGPIFSYDPTYEQKHDCNSKLVSDVVIISYRDNYYLEVNIGKERKTVKLPLEIAQEALEKDATGAYLSNVTPTILAYRYFGHELPYMGNSAHHIETQRTRVYVGDDELEPYRFEEMMPSNRQDYSEFTPPSRYTLVCRTVEYYQGRYTMSVDVKRGIYGKMAAPHLRKGVWKKVFLDDIDLANYLERDGSGSFTCRVSPECVAWKHLRNNIIELEDLIKIHKAKIPSAVAEAYFGPKDSVEKTLKDFSMRRNGWEPVSFMSKKQRDLILQRYREGWPLSRIRKRFSFSNYGLIYSIIKKDIDMENPPLPDDIGLLGNYELEKED